MHAHWKSISVPAALALLATLGGCTKPTPPAAEIARPSVAAPPAKADAQAAGPSGQGGRRRGEASVYVDGKPLGVLRVLELPSSLKPRMVKLSDGVLVPRYAIGDYLSAVGVDVRRVRAVHFYSGERVSALAGSEVRRLRDRLAFGFTQDDRGKPRLVWPTEKVAVETTIDMITGVAIYVDKEAPVSKDGALSFSDGNPVDGIPYVSREQGSGTRLYVDGALVATLKRKTLTNDLLVGGDAAGGRFSLSAYLARQGALAGGAPRAIDFVVGDDVVDRLDAQGAKDVAFAMPSHSRGLAKVELPIEAKSARVSAIELFVRTKPPTRQINPAAAVASNDEGGRGQGAGGGPGAGGAPDEAL